MILSIATFAYFFHWLKKEHFNLSDALSGNKPVALVKSTTTNTTLHPNTQTRQCVANPITASEGAAQGQTTEVSNSTDALPRSISRLIVFMTGITAIICCLCFVTIFMYAHLSGNTSKLKFDSIWQILGGLGIGTIPYGLSTWKEKSALDQGS
jgi:hypothetical protein